jgi:hypothetical protein
MTSKFLWMVLSFIDRCLSTSISTRLRSFSQIKVTHRMTCGTNYFISSHQFVYYDLRSCCSPLHGIYAYFLSVYSIFWTSLIPQIAMLIFGIITYYNIRKSHRRLIHPKEQQPNQPPRSRTDSQLITITLIQVLCSTILINIRTASYSYKVLSTNLTKDNYRRAVECFCKYIIQ